MLEWGGEPIPYLFVSRMRIPAVITIDGPAGAGKSTLGALLAEYLGYLYFDTGVMYRALTLVVLRAGLDLTAEEALEALAAQVRILVVPPTVADGRHYTVLVDDEDVTWAIRDPAVERNVSQVARHPGVRRELIRQQRAIAQGGRVVMVGRDIGTIVMPDAELKLFLETSLDERARRRTDERRSTGTALPLPVVRADLARRDNLDQHVLYPASDAVVLHTDGMNPADELAWVINYLQSR
jgi:cytidylate kinase